MFSLLLLVDDPGVGFHEFGETYIGLSRHLIDLQSDKIQLCLDCLYCVRALAFVLIPWLPVADQEALIFGGGAHLFIIN